MKPKRTLTVKEAKLKAADYCAYQERTQQQVRDKLFDLGLSNDEVEDVLTDLITEGFINEERFAISYAGGKFRMKKWGRVKIAHHLKALKISDYCINRALAEIDEDDYRTGLKLLLEKKRVTVSGENQFVIGKKLAAFLIQKGYEPELVWDLIREL
ncbi:RecX family transcriptional regulator [Fulvivirga ulvae]|uniref:regulatory protein RecX n=1 Tax=Fulvivirga ulvae TaxID=2904245 RepID=UPI001F293B26|nr:RecX family transcriptional regulator [Fulvivirga ulvae]UII34451.1 RecX family transcriptional regulator [Fulvivirga ulvae]